VSKPNKAAGSREEILKIRGILRVWGKGESIREAVSKNAPGP